MNLHVGVLHYTPSCEPFPLLADPVHYIPDTQDINTDREEMEYWLGVLHEQIPTVVAKAVASDHKTAGAACCASEHVTYIVQTLMYSMHEEHVSCAVHRDLWITMRHM